jgi:hypothetical protein
LSSLETHQTELDDQLILMVPLEHTKTQYQILRLQPSLKHMVTSGILDSDSFYLLRSFLPLITRFSD